MRALHAEGDLRPTVPRIAARAGVSLRTVWQQFADREALLVEAVRQDREIHRSLVGKIDPGQPLPDRIEAFIAQRARVFEVMAPTWRAARVHQPLSAELQEDKKRRNAKARAEVEQVFATELAMIAGQERERLADGLHAVTLWPFWESLRTDLELSPQVARIVLTSTFTGLLHQAGIDIQS